jgi:hypothetical protein
LIVWTLNWAYRSHFSHSTCLFPCVSLLWKSQLNFFLQSMIVGIFAEWFNGKWLNLLILFWAVTGLNYYITYITSFFGKWQHATHTIVFAQLHINGRNEGVHAFIAQIRDSDGDVCPNIRIADCGHKIGLNGVDNGRIWLVDHILMH